jgi:cellulase/cellobiase CelA1
MCDPTYAPPGAGWNGALTGALPNAPLSGGWFPAQIDQLVTNANPAIGGGGSTPTPVRTASPTPTAVRTGATPSATATAVRTASPTPIGTSSGTATCSAAFAYSSQWGNGFTANITVNNTGTVATKTWKVTWTWSGNQSIVNSWNAAVTSSGTFVTALNMPYNNVIAAGGNTQWGLQASFSGTVTAPTLTCSAT